MAKGLVQAGHQVTILTEIPNHPAGVVHPGYRGKLWFRRKLDGIDVIHVWVHASPKKTLCRRLSFYLSYMLLAVLAGVLLARGKYDVLYCTSPPLFVGGAGLVLSYLRRIPMVFEVRDLWPESAVALGELSNTGAVRLLEWLAKRCYARSLRVVTVTAGLSERLEKLGIPSSKIVVIPNGSDTELFQPRPGQAVEVRSSLGLKDELVVVYAGILGVAQGLEVVLDAAREIQGSMDVQFLIIGAGPRERALRDYCQSLKISNVRFLGEKPVEEIPAFLTAADIALVPLRDVPLFSGAMPSKMFDAWACACPTVITFAGEAEKVLNQAGAGVVVKPEDPEALAEAIRTLAESRSELQDMGFRGQRFVREHYSRKAQAEALEGLLESVVG